MYILAFLCLTNQITAFEKARLLKGVREGEQYCTYAEANMYILAFLSLTNQITAFEKARL